MQLLMDYPATEQRVAKKLERSRTFYESNQGEKSPDKCTVFGPLTGCATGEAGKKQASYHYQMGLSYLGENNATGALVELTEAEKTDPDNPELLNYLGLAYYRKNKFELAEQKYLKALALKPNFPEARNNLGVDYLDSSGGMKRSTI